MSANRRDKERRELRRASAKEWATKEDKAFEPTSIKLPEGVKWWKAGKPGIYKLDVIPYVVGHGNPKADEGMLHFERSYAVHRGLGLEGRSSYCCAVRCFKKKCYVCDWMLSHGDDSHKELVGKLRPQDRLMLCVIDVTTRDSKEEGIQVFDQPYGTQKHPSFGQMLKDKIASVEQYEKHDDLENGYTMVLKIVEDSFPGSKPYMKVANFEMVPRGYAYPDEYIDKCPCLDACVLEFSYEEMKKIMTFGGVEEEDDESGNGHSPAESAPTPSSKKKEDEEEDEEEEEEKASSKVSTNGKHSEDDDDDDLEDEDDEEEDSSRMLKQGDEVNHRVHGDCTILRITPDGKQATLEDDDGEYHKGVKVTELKLQKKTAGKPSVDEDDEDDD